MSQFDINNFPNEFFFEAINLRNFQRNSNFIQQLICSFHDYDNLYLVSKFYDGFIMNYLKSQWNEKQIQFFSACLIQSFEILRKEQFIHRDINFGNLVLDEKQYINIIDFHIAIKYKYKNNPKNNFVGSPELCAPEMINKLNYDYNSDYYRLGGIIYYNIFRKFPNNIFMEKNLTNIKINYNETKNYSFSCVDFINKLITYDYEKRIGLHHIEDLKNHVFFKNFNWDKLINGTMKSPFPKILKKDLGFCNKPYNFTKKIFIKTSLSKNKTFRNIFLDFDNINQMIVEKIFLSFKYN